MIDDWKRWHGFSGQPDWPLPKLVAESDEAGRADQGNMIKANEYLDDDGILRLKMEIVAGLLKNSKRTVAYTGAGLSKASGIPDYATKSKDTVVQAPKITSNLDAQPTYAHCTLTVLERAGYVHHYVQQNHDGLPQKSGFPQEKINEIHGAWFDPSNPVVKFGGNLRSDLFDWMAEEEKKVDLCICLGTSLSGMNADRMANTPAKKSLKGKALGTVLINLQQTKLDGMAVVRIWAKIDDCFNILGELLGLGKIAPQPFHTPEGDCYEVPYNSKGTLDTSCKMMLDLRKGSKVIIPVEHAMNYGVVGEIIGKRDRHYSILLQEEKGPVKRLLGEWWVHAAINGLVPFLPVVNFKPVVVLPQPQKEQPDHKDILPDFIQIVQSHFLILDVSSGDNKHHWGLSLSPSAEPFVEKVIWELHHTFRDREVHCTSFPFSIKRKGWGTFDVKVTIHLKSKYSKPILYSIHELTFDNEGDEVKKTVVIIPK